MTSDALTPESSAEFDLIAAAIAGRTGIPFRPRAASPVGGGSIHRAWHIDDGSRHYFVKANALAAAPMFAAEAQGLQALSAAAVVPTPTFVTLGQTPTQAFLVLDYLDLSALDRAGGARLGAALAQLHRVSGDSFGWREDNFIGATPQFNAPHPGWPHFFGERRLRPQLQFALQNGVDKALVAKGYAIIERIGGLFIDYQPAPSLLHGDLWSGNAAQTREGTPVIFDPACYYGDRETDIAMAELFGGFPSSFFAAYRAAWPLDSGYETRKPLYNLYHILNHFNLFGSAYLGQAQRMIEGLLRELKR
ncbi:MAG: fructosamine kinase [Rhodocyclaceae bacterium]|nr:MAG: fructosamine kinase [Rhodocyclaceae bacterium]TND00803.1 MAG: fructosamine kinase [Rhodocyclaceae bacterium]